MNIHSPSDDSDVSDASPPRRPRQLPAVHRPTNSSARAPQLSNNAVASVESSPSTVVAPSANAPHSWQHNRNPRPSNLPTSNQTPPIIPQSPSSSDRASHHTHLPSSTSQPLNFVQSPSNRASLSHSPSPSLPSPSRYPSTPPPPPAPPNRFAIHPGPRWDGVVRSNGFERRLAEMRASRTRQQAEDYRASVSDL